MSHEMEIVTKGAVRSSALPVPVPRVPITIRPGTMDDIPFMDALQKLHSKQVGWMPTKQFEGKIKAGHVLVAWASSPCSSLEDNEANQDTGWKPVPLGYCIGNDQYFKRDDVGIIYQMNVAPGHQRGLIGASLLKAQFERSAYGCRLYCCWCAQDIAANRYWEAMGFVPLAFRAGSEKKARVHIFWQKRIRAGDTTTPWWFPSQTAGGSIREDRIVLPIPPGTHWSDAKPLLLPAGVLPAGVLPGQVMPGEAQRLETPTLRAKRPKVTKPAAPPIKGVMSGGLRFAPALSVEPLVEKPKRESKQKTHRVKVKNDPRLVAAARELRDRWLEQVNTDGFALPAAKYDMSRHIGEAVTVSQVDPKPLSARPTYLLPAA